MATTNDTEYRVKPHKPKSLEDLQARWISHFRGQVETVLDRSVSPQDLVNQSLDPDKEKKIWAILYNAYGECASEILDRDNPDKKGTKAWENLLEDLEPQTLRRIIDIQTAANRLQVTSDRSRDEAIFQEVQGLNKQIMSLKVTHKQLCICNLMWAFQHEAYATEHSAVLELGANADLADVRKIFKRKMDTLKSTGRSAGKGPQNTGFLGQQNKPKWKKGGSGPTKMWPMRRAAQGRCVPIQERSMSRLRKDRTYQEDVPKRCTRLRQSGT